MIVKQLSNTSKDVFFGATGWDVWARVVRTKGVWQQATNDKGEKVGTETIPDGILKFMNTPRKAK